MAETELKRRKKTLIMRSMKLLHLLVTVALFVGCWVLFYHSPIATRTLLRYDVLMSGFYVVETVFFIYVYEGYTVGLSSVADLVYALSLSDLLSLLILYGLQFLAFMKWVNPLPMLGVLAIQVLFNFFWAAMATRLYFRIHKPKRTAIVYRNENDLSRVTEAKNFPSRFEIVKYIRDPEDDIAKLFAELDGIQALFVAGVNATLRNALAKFCVDKNLEGYFAPHVGDLLMMGAKSVKQFSVPIVHVHRSRPHPEYLLLKRFFDIALSAVAIVALSPIMLVCAIAIKAYDRGPVLYKQVRLTRGNREYKIWKFRTMRVDAEKDGVARLSTGDNDDRITPVGRVLRRFRLDELMQLFNILGGSMSIVGPRPERPEIAKQYEKTLPAFSLRLQVKAGLTGYAQVYGRYNSTPYDKLQMDLIYINRMSVFEDLKLIFATVRILFMKESTAGITVGTTTAMNAPCEKEQSKAVDFNAESETGR